MNRFKNFFLQKFNYITISYIILMQNLFFYNPLIIYGYFLKNFKNRKYYISLLRFHHYTILYLYNLGFFLCNYPNQKYISWLRFGTNLKEEPFLTKYSYKLFFILKPYYSTLFSFLLLLISYYLIIIQKIYSPLLQFFLILLFFIYPIIIKSEFEFFKHENFGFSYSIFCLSVFNINPDLSILLYSISPKISFTSFFFTAPFLFVLFIANATFFNRHFLIIGILFFIFFITLDLISLFKNFLENFHLIKRGFISKQKSSAFKVSYHLIPHLTILSLCYFFLFLKTRNFFILFYILIFSINYIIRLLFSRTGDISTFYRYYLFLSFFFFNLSPSFNFTVLSISLFSIPNIFFMYPHLYKKNSFYIFNYNKIDLISEKIKNHTKKFERFLVESRFDEKKNSLPIQVFFNSIWPYISTKLQLSFLNDNIFYFNNYKLFHNLNVKLKNKKNLIKIFNLIGASYYIIWSYEEFLRIKNMKFKQLVLIEKKEFGNLFFPENFIPENIWVFKIKHNKLYTLKSGKITYFNLSDKKILFSGSKDTELIIKIKFYTNFKYSYNQIKLTPYLTDIGINFTYCKILDDCKDRNIEIKF